MQRAVPSVRPAATSTRVGAALLDLLITWVAFAGIATVIYALGVEPSVPMANLVFIIPALLYEVGLTTAWGQTIGKRVLGIVVVDDRDSYPSPARSLGRYLVKTLLPLALLAPWLRSLALFLGVYPIVLLITIATDGQRRGWHDHGAATTVVEVAGRRSARVRPTSDPQQPLELQVLTHSKYGRYRKRRIRKR